MLFSSRSAYKALTVLSAFAVITLSAPSANAQGGKPSVITSGDAVKGQIGIGAGDYNFTNLDKNPIMEEVTKTILARSKEDLVIFRKATAEVQAQFQRILDQDVWGPNGLKTYSINSVTKAKGPADYTSVDNYMNAVTSFEKHALELQNTINQIKFIVGAFPSQVPMDIGDAKGTVVKANIPSYGQINFDQVVNFYTKALNDIRDHLNNLPQNIQPANSKDWVSIKQNEGTSLNPLIPTNISPGALIDLQNQLVDLRRWRVFEENGNIYDPMDDYMKPWTDTLRLMVHEFIFTFGKSEWHRYDQHTLDITEKQYKEYVDFFYGRSFMRAYFGMPIGTFGVKYKTLAFNLDKLFSPQSVEILDTVIIDQTDYPRIEKAFGNVLNTVSSRTQAVFGKGVNFLDRVNSAFTWLRGSHRLAVTNKMMFELLYQDFQEDQALVNGKLEDFKKLYDTRYKGSPDQVEFFNHLKPKYVNLIKSYVDPDLELSDEGAGSSEDPFANGTTVVSGGTSVMGALTKAMVAFQSKQNDFATADEIVKKIAAITKIQKVQREKGKKRLQAL